MSAKLESQCDWVCWGMGIIGNEVREGRFG